MRITALRRSRLHVVEAVQSGVFCHRIKRISIVWHDSHSLHACDQGLEGFRLGYIWLDEVGSRWRIAVPPPLINLIVPDDQTTSYAEPLSSSNLRPILHTICHNRHFALCVGSVYLLGKLPAKRDSRCSTAFHQRILRVNTTPPSRLGAESGKKAVKRNVRSGSGMRWRVTIYSRRSFLLFGTSRRRRLSCLSHD
jgi:hypothetical protein